MLAALSSARIGLGGLALSGLTFAFLGAMLPAWGYHLRSDYREMGTLFLALNLGFLAGIRMARGFLNRLGLSRCLAVAAATSSFCYAGLIFTEPPAPGVWRYGVLAVLGLSTGLFNPALFELLSDSYRRAAAPTINLAGILFVLGALLACLTVAGAIEGYALWLPLAGFSGLFALFVWWIGGQPLARSDDPSPVSPTSDYRNPAAILLALVLFFQFAGEWSLAAWLPVFVTQRLGISPFSSLFLLAFYWLALLFGRIAARTLLERIRHRRLLVGSLLLAAMGCSILGLTTNRGGATMAVLFAGSGFAMVYPLVVEMIGHRFRYFHPIYLNGIFSLALAGGLLAPWMTGLLASAMGIQVAILIPLFTTSIVFVLLLLIWLDSRFHPVEG